MGDVIRLPGSARDPIPKPPRQHGPYPCKAVVPHVKMIGLRRQKEWDARLAQARESQRKGVARKEAVETLEWMLQEARLGKLRDLCTVFLHDGGGELMARTGKYTRDPEYLERAIATLMERL